jgi:hypothetical protein
MTTEFSRHAFLVSGPIDSKGSAIAKATPPIETLGDVEVCPGSADPTWPGMSPLSLISGKNNPRTLIPGVDK